jgi:hypothetical protein
MKNYKNSEKNTKQPDQGFVNLLPLGQTYSRSDSQKKLSHFPTPTRTGKRSLKAKAKVMIVVILLLTILVGTATLVIKVNNWFESHRFVFHSPIEISYFQPVRVEVRKPQIIIEKFVLDYPEPIDTPLKKYICDKRGVFDCKTAHAVFTAESGLREDALHINENNTIDYGIAQINSIHFKQPGCSMKEIVIAEKNIDCAYSIWKAAGGSWTPWVGFNNGNFKSHL